MLVYIIAFCLPLALFIHAYSTIGHRRRNMPNGPPTTPFLGNLLQMPTSKLFLKLDQWAKEYGDCFALTIGPSYTIVLTSRNAVKQVLDKQSAISSNRPVSLLRQELLTGGEHLLWMNATTQWRDLRKLIHADLTQSMCNSTHAPLQHAESVQMLYDMIQDQSEWRRHIERFTNSLIMCLVYGIRQPRIEDPYILRFEELMRQWTVINRMGATPPVDIIPALNWVPERFFNNWKSRARAVHDEMRDLYDGLHDTVVRRRQRIGSAGSMVDRMLDQSGEKTLTRHQIANLGGVTIKGGSDTSATTLANFVTAMVLHPEIQKKAQAEIDREVPSDRIPDLSDFGRLPYVMAIIKEVQRWRPVFGIGPPHELSEDIWLDGKLLPKGSTVFLNNWTLCRDEKRYPNPEKFDPDRFEGFTGFASEYANVADPEKRDHYAYGNGRRLCPGIHLAERNIMHAASKMLWAFDMTLPTDPATGKPIGIDTDITTGYVEGLVLSIKDFPVDLKVRSEDRRKAIEESHAAANAGLFSKYDEAIVASA
ncbi:cytochrome P450 family 619 [Microdochium nivale]|nr:cytochrome P450 family 619 [Microdochium nivale]